MRAAYLEDCGLEKGKIYRVAQHPSESDMYKVKGIPGGWFKYRFKISTFKMYYDACKG